MVFLLWFLVFLPSWMRRFSDSDSTLGRGASPFACILGRAVHPLKKLATKRTNQWLRAPRAATKREGVCFATRFRWTFRGFCVESCGFLKREAWPRPRGQCVLAIARPAKKGTPAAAFRNVMSEATRGCQLHSKNLPAFSSLSDCHQPTF